MVVRVYDMNDIFGYNGGIFIKVNDKCMLKRV